MPNTTETVPTTPCCDYGRTHPDDEGDDGGYVVEICQHLLAESDYTYDADEAAEFGQTLIVMTETPGALTEHACADATCPRSVLCGTHWTELL